MPPAWFRLLATDSVPACTCRTLPRLLACALAHLVRCWPAWQMLWQSASLSACPLNGSAPVKLFFPTPLIADTSCPPTITSVLAGLAAKQACRQAARQLTNQSQQGAIFNRTNARALGRASKTTTSSTKRREGSNPERTYGHITVRRGSTHRN